jgi:hypothetical protein
MSKQPHAGSPTPKQVQVRRPLLLILSDIADTAWRMFLPTIGATLAGLWIDKQLHTTPWIMIGMMLLGAFLAGLLVRQQLKKVKSLE